VFRGLAEKLEARFTALLVVCEQPVEPQPHRRKDRRAGRRARPLSVGFPCTAAVSSEVLKSVRRGSPTLGRFDSGAPPGAKNQKAVKRSAVPSVVPVAFVGNMVTLRVINLDEPAKPARQA
jgi:hypothetical protein